MKKLLLASTCALACAAVAVPALADGIAATGQGTYGNIAGHTTWTADGSVNLPLDWYSGLSVEGNVGDRGFSSIHVFDAGGSVIWTDPDFRLAGSVLYNDLTSGGSSIDATQFGAGAEWYFNPWLTASARGGAIAGKVHGGYFGGTVKWYVMPDLAVDGFIDYTDLAHKAPGAVLVNETNYGAHVEWLPMEDIPVTVGANYTRVHLAPGSTDTDTWFLAIKFYFNDSPATTLVDRQRTGTLDTISPTFHFLR